jgi:hypothetical protein
MHTRQHRPLRRGINAGCGGQRAVRIAELQ